MYDHYPPLVTTYKDRPPWPPYPPPGGTPHSRPTVKIKSVIPNSDFNDFHIYGDKNYLFQYDTSFRTVDDDFGRKIGKIRYHFFKNWDF